MLFSKKSEEYYIRDLIKEDKNCWKMNMNSINSWHEIKKTLKRMNLNEKDHPFLVEFKKKAPSAKTNEEIRYLMSELYNYSKKYNILNNAEII